MRNLISLLNSYKIFGKTWLFLGGYSWLNDVYDVLPNILWIILAAVGGAGIVYSIILGINLAKSDSDDKRKTASTRLKNTIIGIAVLVVLVLVINFLIPLVISWIGGRDVVSHNSKLVTNF